MTQRLVFRVPGRTGSVADVLEGVGAAFLLCTLAGVAPESVRLRSEGDGLRIELPADAKPDGTRLSPLIPYFQSTTSDRVQPNRGEVYDYAEDKSRNDQAKAAAQKSPEQRRKNRRRVAAVTEEGEDRGQPSRRFPQYNALQMLTKGGFAKDWNDVWKILDDLSNDHARALADEAWAWLQQQGPVPPISTRGRTTLTLSQHFNPLAAKGAHGAKSGSVSRKNLSGDPFREWLKMVAFDRMAILRRVDNDIRLWMPIPHDIGLDAFVAAHDKLVATGSRHGNVAQDVLMALDFADGLARYWLDSKRPPRTRANRTIRGFETVSFKDMGGGYNVMNLARLGLPAWIELNTEHDLEVYLNALEGFRKACRSMDEQHSDDIQVLIALREAVSGDDEATLLEFLTEYAVLVQRALASPAGRLPHRFEDSVLDALVGGVERMLEEIVKNEGFRNVAAAIRQATVTEQWHKREGKQVYEIHYGLFADLKRAARSKEDFLVRLADFVSKYNAETARVLEAHREQGRRRKRVTDADLDCIVALVDKHGSELVAKLLCAYGSAKVSRDDGDADAEDGQSAPTGS